MDACHHLGTPQATDLNAGETDSAGGARHEQALTLAQGALAAHRIMRRDEHFAETPRLRPRHRRRHGEGGDFRDEGELGLRGAADDGHDTVAHVEALQPLACGDDHAGKLHAGMSAGNAGRRGVQPRPLHEIGAVQPGGFDLHEQFARLRYGIGPFGDSHLTVMDHDCSHDLAL